VGSLRDCMVRTAIAHVAAAIEARIRIHYLAPDTGPRHADTIIVTWRRRHVAYDKHRHVIVVAKPDKGEHRVGAIVAYDPAKPRGLAVTQVQRGFAAIEPVEIAHQP